MKQGPYQLPWHQPATAEMWATCPAAEEGGGRWFLQSALISSLFLIKHSPGCCVVLGSRVPITLPSCCFDGGTDL